MTLAYDHDFEPRQRRWSKPTSANPRFEDDVFSDHFIPTITRLALDTAALPGVAATPEMLAHERTRERLISLVELLRTHQLSWSLFGREIDDLTASTACELLKKIPVTSTLPKIAPDGEGGLALLWETNLMVVIDRNKLHVVLNPASDQTQHVDDLGFDGEAIPAKVLESIPSR